MLFAILTIIAYSGALLWVVPTLVNLENQVNSDKKPNIKAVFSIGLLAVVLHLLSVSSEMLLADGQNFTLANVNALMSLLLSAVATLALPKWRTLWFPLMVVYTYGICSVAVTLISTGHFTKNLSENAGLIFHLGIALFSYALFFLALIYAFQLKWLDHKLKSKKMLFCAMLPPLMTVERHFFTLTLAAQALLTVTLVSGMIYLHNFFAPEQVHKAMFSLAAWIVYNIQLLGQWKLRWRGNRVLVYSILGMLLLSVGYFGSHLI
ncbi:cytochrome C assembly family protein [Actinobacillus minor]|uniref:cytochrome C assembly family protein n=1 Tax=Actinobacillus minor TaxID=51047 RepID=UPI0023F2929D|nr:cytochrome c biogenesis protein CcsA [Actinobacillus minor]MDD6910492.1 cytochrome c biogenesis protein CcsA [Actinobacillus minor]MDY4713896.1 cytochrome c biogenesis protein CcsA [Actinobacillus minor]MDY5107313.1 cytochrome c biogenesis protein CcsA [Actinobacillus minor]